MTIGEDKELGDNKLLNAAIRSCPTGAAASYGVGYIDGADGNQNKGLAVLFLAHG